ncbi:MAG: hypothetical protein JXR76_24955 [Deltaproteobacteria bacterium]|nr:hypothetical protein [Deltaproteobacteria bacterium]
MKKKKVDIYHLLKGTWDDGTRPKDIFASIVRDHSKAYVSEIIAGISCGESKIENGCAELASLVSEKFPEQVYPHVKVFIDNIDERQKKVLRWEAVCVLGSLARVDKGGIIVPVIPKIKMHLRDKSIVLAGHAVRALSKMAVAYPDHTMDIFNALTTAADAFPGNKIGFVIEAMAPIIELNRINDEIRSFVQPYAQSPVKVVARKTAKVLRMLS